MTSEPIQELDLVGWVAKSPEAHRGFREAVHIVLTAISTSLELRSRMVMKGGLLLAIRYDSTRFTRDADFSTCEMYARDDQDALLSALDAQIESANDRLAYDTMCRRQSTRLDPSREDDKFPTLRLGIGYAPKSKPAHLRRLLAGQSPTIVQIDYSYNEAVYDVEVMSLGNGEELQAYSLKNLLAEKYRALLQQPVRNRYRRQDIYDLDGLLAACVPLSDDERRVILKLLSDSCRERGIDAGQASLRDPRIRERAAKEYDSLSAEIQGPLPDFESAYERVQAFYEGLPW